MNARLILLAGLAAFSAMLSACAMTPLPPPAATLDNIQALRTARAPPMTVGAFVPGPGNPTEMDKGVMVRAGYQPAPDGSFAKYLGDTISAELRGAGKLDPGSSVVISGVITDTHLDSTIGTAHAMLTARITLARSGKVRFEKTLSVESVWDSNFIGAVAIPDAINHYTDLFHQLVAKLFADPDFLAAAKGG